MKLFRFIDSEEATILLSGEIIKPIQSKARGKTTLPEDVLYFLPYIDETYIHEAYQFLMGIVGDDYVIVVDIPEDRLIKGVGTYADLTSDDWADTIDIDEYGTKDYSLEDLDVLYEVTRVRASDTFIALTSVYSKRLTEATKTSILDKQEVAPNIYLRDSGVNDYIKTLYYIEDDKTKSLLDYFYKEDNIFISDVVSFHPYKSKGYATKLLKQLIKLFPDKTLELYVVPGFGVNEEYLINWYKDVFGFEVAEGYVDGLIVDEEVIMRREPTKLLEQTKLSNKIDESVKRIISLYAPANLVDQYVDMFYEYLEKYMLRHKHEYTSNYDYLDKVKQLASVWIQSKINLNLYENRRIK